MNANRVASSTSVGSGSGWGLIAVDQRTLSGPRSSPKAKDVGAEKSSNRGWLKLDKLEPSDLRVIIRGSIISVTADDLKTGEDSSKPKTEPDTNKSSLAFECSLSVFEDEVLVALQSLYKMCTTTWIGSNNRPPWSVRLREV